MFNIVDENKSIVGRLEASQQDDGTIVLNRVVFSNKTYALELDSVLLEEAKQKEAKQKEAKQAEE